jgi:hypothetical protein
MRCAIHAQPRSNRTPRAGRTQERPRYRHLRRRYIHWRRLHDLALAELDAILAEILAEPEAGR